MTVVALTDRPKSVRNSCVIECFVASLCNFDLHCVSFRGVCHMTASNIFSFDIITFNTQVMFSFKIRWFIKAGPL